MVNPVQFTNNHGVYFRGKDDELLSSPGAFQRQDIPETPEDEVVLSNKADAPKKKGSVGKTIAKLVATLAVVGGALFGLFKWKGAKWLNPEATGFMEKAKNWAVKPGEWLEKQGQKIIKKLGFSGKAAEEAADAAEAAIV